MYSGIPRIKHLTISACVSELCVCFFNPLHFGSIGVASDSLPGEPSNSIWSNFSLAFVPSASPARKAISHELSFGPPMLKSSPQVVLFIPLKGTL